MATLLMIESWLQSTGLSLPPLIRQLGHRYILVTREPGLYSCAPDGTPHPVVACADEIVKVDTNDHRALAAAATAVAGRRHVDGVVTTCDYYLESAAECARVLGLPGPSPDSVRRALQKHEVRAATARAGVAGPRYAVAGTWAAARESAEKVGYPLVAKPVDLNSGTSVRRVDHEAALKDAFWEITGTERNTREQPLSRLVLMEELLEGPEVSVEAVTQDGETTIAGVTSKTVGGSTGFVECGHLFPAPLEPGTRHEVEAVVRETLSAVGYTYGVSHTEVVLTAAGPRIVELNPRQGGGYIFDLVRLVTGTHLLEVLIDLALGDAPRIGTPATPVGDAAGGGAAVCFVMAPRDGRIVGVEGVERLAADPDVRRWELPVPVDARRPRDNNDRLGHVLTVGPDGRTARGRAAAAVAALRLRMADGSVVAPFAA